ncbi:hypothetical protein ACFSCX_22425 [Bacillus salitolerans]|uniref:Uncharacterized protein n=1 Tax=Bacillus salitolerans TaxID=1437434 RepID=A0ABW4LYM4_9BACI
MSNEVLYVSDNFFSAGRTDIYNSDKVKIGELDLKSAFTSSLDVYDLDGNALLSGRFPFFSNKWMVTDQAGREIGELKAKFAFFSEKYEYYANAGESYRIESEAFSKLYQILDRNEKEVARFEKVSGFFSSPVFQLTNSTGHINSFELIAVVMGVNEIKKRRQSAANSGGGAH